MGEWLFKEENYTPSEDKDKFIDKSIVSILKVLSIIKKENETNKKSGIYAVNPIFNILFTVAVLICISTSRNTIYIALVCGCTLISLFFLNKNDIKKVIALSLILPFFSAVMLVPSMLTGNIKNSLLIILKVFITIMIVNMLSCTSKWNELAKTFKLFFIPDIFIFILEITLRYIYILGEAAMEIFYALRLRSIGRNNKKYNSLSGVIGNLFLKSKDMGEEMYYAMECRGFTGEYVSNIKFKLGLCDIIYLLYNSGLIVMFFWLK